MPVKPSAIVYGTGISAVIFPGTRERRSRVFYGDYLPVINPPMLTKSPSRSGRIGIQRRTPRLSNTKFPSNNLRSRRAADLTPVKIDNHGSRLSISEIPELTAVNSAYFRDELRTALSASPTVIEIDLSQTRFLDSSGLGVLFALYRACIRDTGVTIRLLNPRPEIEQLLELTQLRQLYEVVRR